MTWHPGSDGGSGRIRLDRQTRLEPFRPRIPQIALDKPVYLGLVLTSFGIAASLLIVRTMQDWPAWMLLAGIALSVLAMAATAIGAGLLVVLLMQPLIEGKRELNWFEEPLATLAISRVLQQRCQGLGFLTCEQVAIAVERGTFPWRELSLDERQQLQRAIHYWEATTNRAKGTSDRVYYE